jgi:hypothetical protein
MRFYLSGKALSYNILASKYRHKKPLQAVLIKQALSFSNSLNAPAVLNDELNEHCHQVPGQRSMKCFFSEDEKFSLFCSCGQSVCDETWKKTWKRNTEIVQVDTDDITRRLTLKGKGLSW